MKHSNVFKQLRSKHKDQQELVTLLKNEANETNKKLRHAKKELRDIHSKLSQYTDKDPIVTEHAILRYAERVLNLDTDDIVEKILTQKTKDLIKELGHTGTYPCEGFRIRVCENRVVTIIT